MDYKILRNLKVPTGNIVVMEGENYPLEFLSIKDYGQAQNIKADFLGFHEEIHGVSHGKMLSLEEKWVITVSTQFGCSMNCTFCDVPKVGPGKNLSLKDLNNQVFAAMNLHPSVKTSKRLNLHYARMGEPTWNMSVIESAKTLREALDKKFKLHPVVTTMMPRCNKKLPEFLNSWAEMKNNLFEGNAGLQFSINSTNDKERETMFSGSSLPLDQVAKILKTLPMPKGRKHTLNFPLAGYEIDAKKLAKLFPTNKFICKLTPMHEIGRAHV